MDKVSVSKAWQLTPYEIHRKPHEAITDDTEIALSPRSLHNELMCPICLDILRNTMTTKECLHRFCQECITTALRNSNRECPTCRKKLISKRALRRDPNFDALIAKIFPKRDEYDAQQEKILASLGSNTALQSSIEEGMRLQALNRQQARQRLKKSDSVAAGSGEANPNNSVDDSLDASSASLDEYGVGVATYQQQQTTTSIGSSSSSAPSLSVAAPDVELILRPHPDLGPTAVVRYLRTAGHATVAHLSRYLQIRQALEAGNQTIPPALSPPPPPLRGAAGSGSDGSGGAAVAAEGAAPPPPRLAFVFSLQPAGLGGGGGGSPLWPELSLAEVRRLAAPSSPAAVASFPAAASSGALSVSTSPQQQLQQQSAAEQSAAAPPLQVYYAPGDAGGCSTPAPADDL